MRVDLRVPFAEKDEAKRLGAKWDPAKRVWYVVNVPNLASFQRWLVDPSDPAASAPTPAAKRPAGAGAGRVNSSAGKTVVGSAYVALACDCLPWEGCAKCQGALRG
ncbi:MAG: DUF5710 domain-containing protein [Rhodocyclaceae bacterium]